MKVLKDEHKTYIKELMQYNMHTYKDVKYFIGKKFNIFISKETIGAYGRRNNMTLLNFTQQQAEITQLKELIKQGALISEIARRLNQPIFVIEYKIANKIKVAENKPKSACDITLIKDLILKKCISKIILFRHIMDRIKRNNEKTYEDYKVKTAL